MPTHALPRRLRRWALALGLALATALLVAPAGSSDVASAHAGHGEVTPQLPRTANQLALHDGMRKLWEDHVTWTRLAIVTFAADAEGFDATATRLLHNQDEIGDAIKPYYGEAAGDQLAALLRDHIVIAVDVLSAAKAGDQAAFATARTRWYDNGGAIADFLAQANPRFWPQDQMRAMMTAHLDQTLAEAAHELAGDYQASVADYEQAHAHILMMADALSEGLIGQFPHLVR